MTPRPALSRVFSFLAVSVLREEDDALVVLRWHVPGEARYRLERVKFEMEGDGLDLRINANGPVWNKNASIMAVDLRC